MAKAPSSGSQKTTGRKPRETLVSLRARVDDIVARLEKADALTRRHVEDVETALLALQKQVSQDTQINKAALTKRMDQLSQKFVTQMNDTQSAVAKDLKSVMNNPTLERLEAAVNRADIRVTQAEVAQAAALAKVNKHIAGLAKAVNDRMDEEKRAREKAIRAFAADMNRHADQLESRVKDVEQSSASAIIKLGERMVSMSNDFRERTDNNTKAVSRKITEIAVKTQEDFDLYKKNIERRLESLEDNQRNLDSYTDRTVSTLTTRLDSLEYGLTSVTAPQPFNPETEAAPTKHFADDAFSPNLPTEPYQNPLPAAVGAETAYPPLTVVGGSAVPPEPVAMPPANSYSEPVAYEPPTPMDLTPAETVPQPWQPVPGAQPVLPGNPPVIGTPAPYNPQAYTAPELPDVGQPYAPTVADYAAQTPGGISYGEPASELHTTPDVYDLNDLPYADPAYAENDADPVKRPGLPGLKGASLPKVPVSSRNLKLAGMVLAIAALGWFGVKALNKGTPQAPNANEAQTGGSLFANDPTEERGAPIGRPTLEGRPADRRDAIPQDGPLTAVAGTDAGRIAPAETFTADPETGTSTPPLTAPAADTQTSETPTTLEDAVAQGNPIAEFQFGLTELQNGNMDEAVRLIRSSANKGQPAAQYRLAKLYETGEGVANDPAMARQLTERAASAGNRIAMHDIALYYAHGRGGADVDIATAARWFEKAAERGVVDSQFNLAVLFESGQGLPINLQDAYFWYSIAAAQGDPDAIQRLTVLKDQLSADDMARIKERVETFKPVPVEEAANGVFRNVTWTIPESVRPIAARQNPIKTAQTLLNRAGYNTGTPDGAMGPRTRKAIQDFQKANDLPVTGVVDARLLQALQNAARS